MIRILRMLVLVALVATIPLVIWAPKEWFWELGYVENLQLAVLYGASLLSIYWYFTDNNGINRPVWAISAWFFMLAGSREISWGRVFLATAYDENGPVPPDMSTLWFGPYIYGVVGISVVIMLWLIIKYHHRVWSFVKAIVKDREGRAYCFTAIALMVLSELVFDRNVIAVIEPIHDRIEEMIELIAYMLFLLVLLRGRRIERDI